MAKTQVPIEIMNATALANHVIANMGLDVNPKMGTAGIKAKMAQAGYPTDFVTIDDGKDEPAIRRVEPKRARHKEGQRSVQLRIEQQEKPGGNEPVFTSVNGQAMLIPRSQTCWVPYKYFHALQNAVAKIPEVDADLNITGYREVPEIPVSVFHIEPPLSKREMAEAERREAEEEARREIVVEEAEEEDEYAT